MRETNSPAQNSYPFFQTKYSRKSFARKKRKDDGNAPLIQQLPEGPNWREFEFYKGFFICNRSIMLLIDMKTGMVEDANDAASEFYGWSIEQLKRMQIWQINMLGETLVREKMAEVKRGQSHQFQFQHRTAGEIKDVSVDSSVVQLGGKDYLFSFIIDVTEQRKQERMARRFAEFERAILHLAENFINTPLDRMDESLNEAITQVADFLSADQVSVWKYDWVNKWQTRLCVKNKNEQPSNEAISVPFLFHQDIVQSHLEGNIHRANRPGEWEKEEPLAHIWEAGVQTFVSIPLESAGYLLGKFEITSCSPGKVYSEQEVSIARIFAEMLASVLRRMENEQSIHRNDEIIRQMYDSTNDMLVMLDRDLRIIRINSSVERFLGMKNQDALGLTLADVLPKDVNRDVLEMQNAMAQRVLETGISISSERGVGNFSFVIRCYPIIRDNQIVGVSLHSMDVSFRRKAEQDAIRHEAFQNTILHLSRNFVNMPIEEVESSIEKSLETVADQCGAVNAALWRHEKETGFNVITHVYINNSLENINGYFVHSSLLPHVYEKLSAGEIYFFRRDVEDVDTKLTLLKECRSAILIPLLENEQLVGLFSIGFLEPDKELANVELALLSIFAEMLTNVLKRKLWATALFESEQRYRLLIDSTSDSIGMMNLWGDVLSVNKRFEERFTSDLVGRNLIDILPPQKYGDLCAKRLESINRVQESRSMVRFEDERDGIVYENRMYPVWDENGNINAVVLFSTDISYRRIAEEEAKSKAEYQARLKATTDFFTNISHELKTPLSVLLMQFEIMELCMDDRKQMRKLIGVATRNSYRLLRLVNNLLDITKIDSGYMKTQIEMTDAVALCNEICESVESYAAAKSISIRVENRSKTGCVMTDKEKLERILFNLLSNAIKYSRKDGKIVVSLSGGGNSDLLISVKDTGVGIPEDKLGVIFDRFVQVDPSTSRQNEGSGIGLALVKSLTELLGGKIDVESTLDKGSIFTVRLPRSQHEQESATIKIESYDLKKKAEMELSDLY